MFRFDVKRFGGPSDPSLEDQAGILAAVTGIDSLIQAEVDSGISEERIVVGGFSQGCMLSLLLAVQTERNLAGVLGLSGRVGMLDKLSSVSPLLDVMPSARQRTYPKGFADAKSTVKGNAYFLGSWDGRFDDNVKWNDAEADCTELRRIEKARAGVQTLQELGIEKLEFKVYKGMGHETCRKEVKDIVEFLQKVLP
ncbi:hypothetical protein P7C70_g2784, partial [Phenoliferia sp. Uapishka_3]